MLRKKWVDKRKWFGEFWPMKNQYKSNFRRALVIFVVLLNSLPLFSLNPNTLQDSTKKAANHVFKSTARLHSQGMFSYGGRIGSTHSAFDIQIVYERKAWGFSCFKAVDLVDHTSPNNFALAVFYKNFKLTNRFTITPHAGAFLEQPHSFAGHGSDAAFILISAFKVNPRFTIDHAALVGNLIIEPELTDWVNRIRFLYSIGHIDLTAAAWHNNRAFDRLDYTSCAFSLAINRLKLSDEFNIGFSVTDMALVQSSNTEALPRKNSVVLTLVLQFIK